MSYVTALAEISKIVQIVAKLSPGIIKTVSDAKPFAEAIYKVAKGGSLSDKEVEALEDHITNLSEQLQKPLPPEQ